ncbi:hypothetical protein VNO78_06449 [Psophocarpus tetragonolobus]|uniref:cellulase n=1 Tax=Psophocarpus tetragonolobus TaxID=3891 RepID=A0AAN9XRF0_PSOTE
MLSWSTIEFQKQLLEQKELQNAVNAIRWGTNYLMKAHPKPNVLYREIGDPDSENSSGKYVPVAGTRMAAAWLQRATNKKEYHDYLDKQVTVAMLEQRLVGMTYQNDNFEDRRSDYQLAEPAIVTIEPLVGVLARLV